MFLVDIFTTESRSHGELDRISYEAHVDHGLAVLCGLVWGTLAPVVCKIELP